MAQLDLDMILVTHKRAKIGCKYFCFHLCYLPSFAPCSCVSVANAAECAYHEGYATEIDDTTETRRLCTTVEWVGRWRIHRTHTAVSRLLLAWPWHGGWGMILG